MSSVETCDGLLRERLSNREFQWICRTVYDRAGIDLKEKKILVEARLSKQLRELKLPSFKGLLDHVEHDYTGGAFTSMLDALTTNHTTFFRENQHFDLLRKLADGEFRSRANLRIWSAACSSGEEPYSIAFTLADAFGEEARSKVSILATDISTKVLKIAEKGIYPEGKFQGLPVEQMRRHLLKGVGATKGSYLIKPSTKSLVRFEQLNLMENCSHLGLFSAIFCRNVMIYFDRSTQEALVNRLSARLCPGGYLFIGHAESLSGIRHSLKYIMPAVYKNGDVRSHPIRGEER